MASAYRPTGRKTYRIEFVDQHQVRRIKGTKIKDRRVAEQLAVKVEADAARVRAGQPPLHPETAEYLGLASGNKNYEDALDAFLQEQQRRAASASHVRDLGNILARIRRACQWTTLQDVKADQVGDYLRRLAAAGRSRRTQNHHQSKLSNFLNWCVRQKWLAANPILDLQAVTVGRAGRKHLRRALTPDELLRLLKTARRGRALLYAVAAYSGFRRSELLRLLREDCTVQNEKPRWHVDESRTKNGLAARLPMTPECAVWLTPHWPSLQPGQPLFTSAPNMKTFRADLKRAGIAYRDERGRVADFHALRYTFCALLSKLYPIEIVSKLMRHSSIALTSDVYLELGLDRTGEGEWILQPLLQVAEMPVPDLGIQQIGQRPDQAEPAPQQPHAA